jgi:hypothetical protein
MKSKIKKTNALPAVAASQQQSCSISHPSPLKSQTLQKRFDRPTTALKYGDLML